MEEQEVVIVCYDMSEGCVVEQEAILWYREDEIVLTVKDLLDLYYRHLQLLWLNLNGVRYEISQS